ncbi:MAG: hypothetical protein MZU91_03160 [Desulfosudis oleivorans]|nr:hypothetical protein [Desulfosudis oleivorans]
MAFQILPGTGDVKACSSLTQGPGAFPRPPDPVSLRLSRTCWTTIAWSIGSGVTRSLGRGITSSIAFGEKGGDHLQTPHAG